MDFRLCIKYIVHVDGTELDFAKEYVCLLIMEGIHSARIKLNQLIWWYC